VDKPGFVYSVNGLRAPGCAGKALYPSCTERGQKRIGQQKSGFCTSDAVDMQAFFHRRTGFARFWMLEPACLQTRTLPGSAGLQFFVVGKPGGFSLRRSWRSTFFLKTKKRLRSVGFCFGRLCFGCRRSAMADAVRPGPVFGRWPGVFHAQPFTVFS
jgi:hypothetical protein